MTFPIDPSTFVADERLPLAANQVVEYFAGYAGRLFDRIAADTPSDRFTAADLYAAATLSASIDPKVGVELVEDVDGTFGGLLEQIPTDCTIADPGAAAALGDDAPASQLYAKLRALDGIGKTRASKLLAAKRPALIPIRDDYVERALGAGDQERWWAPMVEAWSNPDLTSQIQHLRKMAEEHQPGCVPPYVTDLRLLDVVIWRSIAG